MNKPSAILSLLAAFVSLSQAGDAILPYNAFGPQVIAHKLIGMEWWQWDPHGDSNPSSKYPIKIVVYWDQTLEATKKFYPVDRKRKKDYRYVTYKDAVKHMEKAVKDLEKNQLDAGKVRRGLKTLKTIKTKTESGRRRVLTSAPHTTGHTGP